MYNVYLAYRAEQWAQEQQNQAKKDAASESRGSFFKRRSARRSKSLSKDHWEDVVFGTSHSFHFNSSFTNTFNIFVYLIYDKL